MSECESENVEPMASFGKGKTWESAFRNLNQCVSLLYMRRALESEIRMWQTKAVVYRAIELIYLVCEKESSVVFVDHAARVFNEASEDFKELKLRIQDQLRFQSYLKVRDLRAIL
jgi:hypothetical protein